MKSARSRALSCSAETCGVVAAARIPGERSLELRADRRSEIQRRVQPRPRRGLRKSDLENKLLITRTSGRNFGAIGEAWVDVGRLWVACFDVVEKRLPIAAQVCGGVYLQSLREVGDVVLIHGDKDFRPNVDLSRQGLVTLSGLRVFSDTGVQLGKVRDFLFDPSSGRILQIIFDSWGLPFLPTEFLDQFAFDVQEIRAIQLSEGAIYLRGDADWKKVGNGKFQYIVDILPGQGATSGSQGLELRDMEDEFPDQMQQEYMKILEESRRQQQAYSAAYGQQSMNSNGVRTSPRQPPRASQPEYARRMSNATASPSVQNTMARARGKPRAPTAAAMGGQNGGQVRSGRKIDEWIVKEERALEESTADRESWLDPGAEGSRQTENKLTSGN